MLHYPVGEERKQISWRSLSMLCVILLNVPWVTHFHHVSPSLPAVPGWGRTCQLQPDPPQLPADLASREDWGCNSEKQSLNITLTAEEIEQKSLGDQLFQRWFVFSLTIPVKSASSYRHWCFCFYGNVNFMYKCCIWDLNSTCVLSLAGQPLLYELFFVWGAGTWDWCLLFIPT